MAGSTVYGPDNQLSSCLTISPSTGSSAPSGYTVTSLGACQGAQRTVEAFLAPRGMIHEYAVFGLEALTLNSRATVDWYNHESGASPLKTGTNSTSDGAITLEVGSYINGDVLVGVGGDPADVILDNGGNYAGSAYAQSDKYRPPDVSVPADLVSGSSGGSISGNRTIIGSGKYSDINLGINEKLIIDGNVEMYVTGDVTIDNAAEIQVNEGCSLVLYVDGNVEGKNGSVFNNKTQDPRSFKLFGTENCSRITLKNSGDMYAVVYAPAAEVIVYNSAILWGAITSRTCEAKTDARIYYDASLANQVDSLLPPILKLASWREY